MSIDYRILLLNIGIPSPCYSRPFVCGASGFPEQHHVLIMGTEVVTNLGTNWWDYWDPESGFNYDRFNDEYVKIRKQRGERTSKSPTRFRYDRIRENCIKAVETNTSKGDGVRDSNRDVVKFLIEKMHNLKAIIVHGPIAHKLIDHFQSQDAIRIPDEYIFRIERMYNASYDYIDSICEKIKGESDAQ